MRRQAPQDLVSFIENERARLLAAMFAYTGDRGLAEDLVQEAFVRAASQWHRVSRLHSPGGWTWRVARNLATSQLRRRGAEARALRTLGVRADDVHADPDIAAVDAVRRALSRLPDAQREAVVLRHCLGHDTASTAALMGSSEAAARKNLQRGVAALRAKLGPADAPADSTKEH